MIPAEELDLLVEPLLGVYRRMEDDLLRRVAYYINIGVGEGAGALSAGDAEWLTMKTMQLGSLRRENVSALAALTKKADSEIERILNAAGYGSLELDEAVYVRASKLGLTMAEALPLRASPQVQRILSAALRNAKAAANLVNTTALQSASSEFLKIINQVYLETSTGLYSYNASVKRAVQRLADHGITGMDYISAAGRRTRTTPEAAVRRMIMTSSAQTAGAMQVERAREWGSNLVEVSSHLGARPSHADWQGQVYMLSGEGGGYRNLSDATGYGSAGGLCGYNCRHSFYPYFEGMSERRFQPYDLRENARVYEQAQEQRYIEREIRQYKRRAENARATGDADALAAATAKVRDKQAKMRGFINGSGRTRRYDREQVYAPTR